MTKPRPRMIDPLIAEARKHMTVTKRRTTVIMAETGVNRSTRVQRAQRVKADAFDRLDEILAGR